MSHGDVNVTNMFWRPALIKLTQIGNPDHDGGEPTPLYVDPQDIGLVCRTFGSFHKTSATGGVVKELNQATGQLESAMHPKTSCTAVGLHGGGGSILVLESVEEVARLRDEAFGHKPPAPKPGLKAVP